MSRINIAVAIVAGTAAFATGSAAFGASPGADDDKKVVCKSRPQTGTRFPKKTCMTRADWIVAEEDAKRKAAELINAPKANMERSN